MADPKFFRPKTPPLVEKKFRVRGSGAFDLDVHHVVLTDASGRVTTPVVQVIKTTGSGLWVARFAQVHLETGNYKLELKQKGKDAALDTWSLVSSLGARDRTRDPIHIDDPVNGDTGVGLDFIVDGTESVNQALDLVLIAVDGGPAPTSVTLQYGPPGVPDPGDFGFEIVFPAGATGKKYSFQVIYTTTTSNIVTVTI